MRQVTSLVALGGLAVRLRSNKIMALWRAGGLLLGLAAGANAVHAAEPPSVTDFSKVLSQFNQMPPEHTPLSLAVAGDDPAGWFADSGTLPGWLGNERFTDQEASALVASVGALGVDQDRYPPQQHLSPAVRYLYNMTLAAVAGGARERSARAPTSSDDSGANSASLGGIAARPRNAARFTVSRQQRFADVLVRLGSCAGAVVSALNVLEAHHPNDRFTDFIRAARDEISSAHLAPDADCSRRD